MSECIEGYARRGIGGISVWRETLEGEDLCSVRQHIRDAGLEGLALVRGGFFTGSSAEERRVAIEKNRECLMEAEALGLPQVVLVCGATPGQTARQNYEQIRDGIGAIAEEAEGMGIRLAIEPLHPVYAGDRSGICSLRDANALAEELSLPNVGVAVDVYHVFWELDLREQLQRRREEQRGRVRAARGERAEQHRHRAEGAVLRLVEQRLSVESRKIGAFGPASRL